MKKVKLIKRSIIEKVKQDYNTIANHFDQTRSVKRSLVRFKWLLDYLPQKKIKVCDIGCGNARMIDFFNQNQVQLQNYLGIDFSKALITMAKRKYPYYYFLVKDIAGDQLTVSGNQEKYNLALCLAVLHHLPDKKSQLKALRNIYQLLEPQGLLVISVWNLWQIDFWLSHLKQVKQKIKQQNLKYLYLSYKVSDGQKIKIRVNRFFYAFTKAELKYLLKKAGYKIIDSFYAKHGVKSNILIGHDLCFVAQKMVE